jgi:hypothetical protein
MRQRPRHRRIDGRRAVRRMVDVGKVGRDGAPVRFGKGGKTMRDGRHRPRRHPRQNAKAVAQIALQPPWATRSGAKLPGGDGLIGAIAGHQAKAKNPKTPRTASPAMTVSKRFIATHLEWAAVAGPGRV